MRQGDDAFVTNGKGIIVRCTIVGVSDTASKLDVCETVVEARAVRPFVLALACLKKEAFAQAVKQCTELGVTRFVPFASDKAHVRGYNTAFEERLRRITLAAMKQAFRATLPEVGGVMQFDDLLDHVAGFDSAVVGDGNAPPLDTAPVDGATLIVVGPEGGFNEGEIEQLDKRGAALVSVSRHRLRAETAAAALAAALAPR
jgi:16S rRNA (uracil1498-N3)-methyltransferase